MDEQMLNRSQRACSNTSCRLRRFRNVDAFAIDLAYVSTSIAPWMSWPIIQNTMRGGLVGGAQIILPFFAAAAPKTANEKRSEDAAILADPLGQQVAPWTSTHSPLFHATFGGNVPPLRAKTNSWRSGGK